MENLIYFGDTVKALGDGRVGGYLVRFTDSKHKDLAGEYFTAETYLGPKDGDGAESLFDHGFPVKSGAAFEALAQRTFAPLKTRRDEIGIWAETVLNMADEYDKAVYGMVERKKLGWSSGAPGHRVRKNADGQITSWPIAEGSLTPCPCEPLNRVCEMKSLAGVKFVELEDVEIKATWSTAFVNDLPDSSFLYIAPGGEKDDDGKTKPRNLRYFPYKDADGKVDLPHLRNALARIPQSDLSQDVKDKVTSKAQKIAKANGVGDDSKDGKSLAGRLTQRITDLVEDGRDRELIVKGIARDAMLDAVEIERIISGQTKRPQNVTLKAIANGLGIPFDILRSIADAHADRSIKDLYSDELSNREPSVWEQWSAFCCVVCKIAELADANYDAGIQFDYKPMLMEAWQSFGNTAIPTISGQIDEYVETDDSMGDMPFYLKSLIRPEDLPAVTRGLDLDEHSEWAVAAFKGINLRFRKNHTARRGESGDPTKAGRVLSDKNRQRLASLVDAMKAVVADCEALLDETKPMASEEEKRAARSFLARLEFENEMAGLGA